MSARRVLFIGGTADGQWRSIPAGHTLYRVPVPVPLAVLDYADPSYPSEIRADDYRIERFVITSGRTVWVAVSDLHGTEREVAIIRALFQRDVATELLRGS